MSLAGGSSSYKSPQIQLLGTPGGGLIAANMATSPHKNNTSNVTFNAQNLTINTNHTACTPPPSKYSAEIFLGRGRAETCDCLISLMLYENIIDDIYFTLVYCGVC